METSARYHFTDLWNEIVNDFRRNFPILQRLLSPTSKASRSTATDDLSFRDRDAIEWMTNYLRHCSKISVPITQENAKKLLGKFVYAGIIEPVRGDKKFSRKDSFTSDGSRYRFVAETSDSVLFAAAGEMQRFQHLELQSDSQSCHSDSPEGSECSSSISEPHLSSTESASSSSSYFTPGSNRHLGISTSDSALDSLPGALSATLPCSDSMLVSDGSRTSPLHLNLIVSPNGRVKRQLSVLEELAISEDKARFVECMNVFHEEFLRRRASQVPSRPTAASGGAAALEIIHEANLVEEEEEENSIITPLARTWSTQRPTRPATNNLEKENAVPMMAFNKDVAVSTMETPLKDEKLEKLRALRNDAWRRQIRKNFRSNMCVTNQELERFFPATRNAPQDVLDYRHIRTNLMYVTPLGLNIEVDARKDLPPGIYNNMLLMKNWESLREPGLPSEDRWENVVMKMICDYFTRDSQPIVPPHLHCIFILGSKFLHQLYTHQTPSLDAAMSSEMDEMADLQEACNVKATQLQSRCRMASGESVPAMSSHAPKPSFMTLLATVKRHTTDPIPSVMNHPGVGVASSIMESPTSLSGDRQLRTVMQECSRFADELWSNTDQCWPRRWCNQTLCDARVASALESVTDPHLIHNVTLLSTLALEKGSHVGGCLVGPSDTVPSTPAFTRSMAVHSTPRSIQELSSTCCNTPSRGAGTSRNVQGVAGDSVNQHISLGPDSCVSDHFLPSSEETTPAQESTSPPATCFTRSCLDAREHRQEWETRSLTQAWKDHLRTCCLLLKPENRRHLMLLLQFLHDVIHNTNLCLATSPRHSTVASHVLDMFVGAVFPELAVEELASSLNATYTVSYGQLYDELQRMRMRHRMTLAFMVLHHRSIMRPSHSTRRNCLREITRICCPALKFEFCTTIRHAPSEVNQMVINYTHDALVEMVKGFLTNNNIPRKDKLTHLDRCKEMHPTAYWAVMKDVANEERVRAGLQDQRMRRGKKIVQGLFSRFKR